MKSWMLKDIVGKIKAIYRGFFHSLKFTLLFWFLTLSLIPFLIVAWYGYVNTVQSVDEMQRNKISTMATLNVATLNKDFYGAAKNLWIWSQLREPEKMLSALSERYAKSSQSLYSFIHSAEYEKLIENQPKTILTLAKDYDYVYDLFLIDLEGNILYTVKKESDLGTNLLSGPYSKTRFSQTYRKSLSDGKPHFSDLERYSPSADDLTGFITQPIVDGSGKVVGIMGLQLDMGILFSSLNEKKKGVSQYLVGADGLLRSSIGNKDEILSRRISTKVFWDWYNEHSMQGRYSDTMDEVAKLYIGPNGTKVLGEHRSINLMGIRWAYITEMDESEVLAIPNRLFTTIVLFSLFGTGVIIFVGIIISRRIVKPIVLLSNANVQYMNGAKGVHVTLDSTDEIGELGFTFNALIQKQEYDKKQFDDLTKEAQKTLIELKVQKYALDVHSIVAITDVQGTITSVNTKFEEISGYKSDELIGKNHRLLNSGVHGVEFWKEMYDKVSHGDIWHSEVCNLAKDGSYYWVDTTIIPLANEDEKLMRYISVRTDITERKKIQEQLIEAKELAESSARTKSEFLATMSHEIRTPMNGVLGMLGLLSHSTLDVTQRHQIRVASNSANSLLVLINDILDFSKVEAGKMELEMIVFKLRDELGEFIEAIAFRAQEKGLELILDTTKLTRCTVIADPGRLRQILTNLIGNAVKFTHQGEVLVRVMLDEVDAHHGRLRIDVRDSGIGIAADKIDSLFESFSQADSSTTRKYGGTGLGLAIAKKLCELMDGRIWITSTEHEGSTFHIDIGVGLGETSALSIPSVSVTDKTVLVVDDNETNRAVIRAQLEMWGMKVYETEDPAIALDYCNVRIAQGYIPPYDVAILDMQMPNMNGADLGAEIRKIPQCDAMKMVMMTSLGDRNDAARFAEIGFDAFFAKPTTTKDLLNTLKILFDEGAALEAANPLIMKDFLRTLQEELSEVIWPSNTRILLVEDNPTNQLVAQGMLDMIGLEADIANNGLEALEAMQLALETAPYTLILMDCQMPQMDGYTASTAIREGKAGEEYKEIPIVAMTANAMSGDRDKCLISGMSDYVSKPINLDTLKVTLIKWMGGKVSKIEANVPVSQQKQAINMENEIQELKVWDEADALKRLGGKKELLHKIMQSFLDESVRMMSALHEAIAAEDLPNVQLHSHSIKGSSANVSGQQVNVLAKAMEFMAKNGDKSVLKEGYVNLEKAMNTLCTLLQKELIQDVQPEKRKKRIDPLQIAIKLQNLKQEIQSGTFIDTDASGIFGEYADEAFTTRMSTLQGHIDRFDTDLALEEIEAIMVGLE